MRLLKAAVIVMGLLIVAGLVVIWLKIYRNATEVGEAVDSALAEPAATGAVAPPRLTALGLPEGSRVQSMTTAENRLILHVRVPGDTERIVIIDLRSGALVGEFALEAGP